MTYYKVLAADGCAMHGGTGRWTPGRWRTVRGPLLPCERALHACRRKDLVHWLGPAIWTFEFDAPPKVAGDKVYGGRGRIIARVVTWTEQAARLFAADCAEAVLAGECADVLRVVRRFAFGLASFDEMSAARSAAWSAARSAAWSAARSAARSAAESAAWSAAGSAAGSAAESAAESAARSAQTERLFAYLDGKVDLDELRVSVA